MSTRNKILLGLGAAIVLILGYFAYIMLTTRSHSPADQVKFHQGDLSMTIDYCRPYKKGRIIFGAKDEGALQPYGVYWRVGANEATEIEFNTDVLFAGKELDKGRYVLYAVPGESTWTIGLNSELGRWGAFEVNHELDIMQVEVESRTIDPPLEQFTIEVEGEGEVALIHLKWDRTDVPIPVMLR